MRRRLVTVAGSIEQVVLGEGLPIRLEVPGRSVSFIGDSLALVIFDGEMGDKNLLVLGPAGDELARLGSTCGDGVIVEVLDVQGEIRAIETRGTNMSQARLDLDTLTLEWVAEWR